MQNTRHHKIKMATAEHHHALEACPPLACLTQEQHLSPAQYQDTLTNLHNRRYLESHFKEFCDAQRRHHKTICITIFDLDHFKKINDTYGHDVGDKVLMRFSQILKSTFRGDDIACRIGGEEFVVVMASNSQQALTRCNKLRERVSKTKISVKKGTSIRFTVSGGIAEQLLTRKLIDLAAFIKAADKKLYQAKKNGRNQIV